MNNFTETVRNSADIVRVVSDYVSLKGTGSTLKGLCPFHSEKTPSFTVHRDKQFFYCFGCHAGGDVFNIVMLAEKVPFPEAVEIVAEKCENRFRPSAVWMTRNPKNESNSMTSTIRPPRISSICLPPLKPNRPG